MKNIFLSTVLLLGSQAPILANSPTTILRYAGVQDSILNSLVTQLEQNAIIIMMSMVILIGLCLIGYVCSAYVKLNKTQQPSPRNISGHWKYTR